MLAWGGYADLLQVLPVLPFWGDPARRTNAAFPGYPESLAPFSLFPDRDLVPEGELDLRFPAQLLRSSQSPFAVTTPAKSTAPLRARSEQNL